MLRRFTAVLLLVPGDLVPIATARLTTYRGAPSDVDPAIAQSQLFWIFPLVFAVIVRVLFVIGFREDAPSGRSLRV